MINSLGDNNTSNTIEVYVYDEAPDGRSILKRKSENDVCVKNTIKSSYESIQSAGEDYLQCDGYTDRKSYVAKISYNDNESHKS